VHAPTAAVLYQFREVALHSRETLSGSKTLSLPARLTRHPSWDGAARQRRADDLLGSGPARAMIGTAQSR
jgi:hypothetical protein